MVRPSTNSLNRIRERLCLFLFLEAQGHFYVIQLAIEAIPEHSPRLKKFLWQ